MDEIVKGIVEISGLEDSQLVAFLKLKGYEITASVCKDDPTDPRIGFSARGNEKQLDQDINSFYHNVQVGIQDYVRCLKDIKSQLYTTRKLHLGGRKS